jgi:hypothetical protein
MVGENMIKGGESTLYTQIFFYKIKFNTLKIFFLALSPIEFGSRVSSEIKWFQPPFERSCGDQTVVFLTKFSTNYH